MVFDPLCVARASGCYCSGTSLVCDCDARVWRFEARRILGFTGAVSPALLSSFSCQPTAVASAQACAYSSLACSKAAAA